LALFSSLRGFFRKILSYAVSKPVLKPLSVFILRWKPHVPPCRRNQLVKNLGLVIQIYLYVSAPDLKNLGNEGSGEPVIIAALATWLVSIQELLDCNLC
jgi:hypothetical protein